MKIRFNYDAGLNYSVKDNKVPFYIHRHPVTDEWYLPVFNHSATMEVKEVTYAGNPNEIPYVTF